MVRGPVQVQVLYPCESGWTKAKNSRDTIAFKTEYSSQLRRFKIKAHIDRLLEKLRAELGDTSFLQDSGVIIARAPSRRSLFVVER